MTIALTCDFAKNIVCMCDDEFPIFLMEQMRITGYFFLPMSKYSSLSEANCLQNVNDKNNSLRPCRHKELGKTPNFFLSVQKRSGEKNKFTLINLDSQLRRQFGCTC